MKQQKNKTVSTKSANRFVRGLKKRGEVVDRTKKTTNENADQPLPSGVTHEIVGYDEDGRPIVRRRRFSSF